MFVITKYLRCICLDGVVVKMLVIGLINIISVNYLSDLTKVGQIKNGLLVFPLNTLLLLKLGFIMSLDARSISFLNLLDFFKQSFKYLRCGM